jgi:hypothetical protein
MNKLHSRYMVQCRLENNLHDQQFSNGRYKHAGVFEALTLTHFHPMPHPKKQKKKNKNKKQVTFPP